MRERLVPGRREAVDPDEIENLGTERPGNLDGPIRAARIDDHDLVEQSLAQTQDNAEMFFSSSLTIMVNETLARSPGSLAGAPSSDEEGLT